MLGGTQYDRAFDAYSRAMKANNNFGMTDKQQIAEQYGRQSVALQQRQIKAENKAFGKALAKEKATLARQAQQATAQTATTANLPAVVKNGKIQLPKISELLSGQGTTQNFTGISQNLPAVVQNGQVVTPNLPAVVRNGQIVTPNLPAVVRNGQIITPNFNTPAQTFAGIKPEYLQTASVEMPAEPVSLVGKTKKQIQKEQKKLWKAGQKKNGTKPANTPATTGSTPTSGAKPVAAGTAATNGASTQTATSATPANGAKPIATGATATNGANTQTATSATTASGAKPVATGATATNGAAQNTGATQNPTGGAKPTSGTTNVQTPNPTPNPAPNPTPNPTPEPGTTKKPGFFKRLGSKIKGVFKKITKTKAGKAGLIVAGIGLLAAGGAWLYNKLKGDNKDATPVKDDKKTVPPKSGDDNNGGKVDDGNGNGGKVGGKDNGEGNGKANGHGGTHKVVKGETIHKIVTDALKEQGIDEPTDEQIKKAKRALLEENAEAVQTYHGKKKEWHGNKFFFPDEELTIPDYKKLLEATEEEEQAA